MAGNRYRELKERFYNDEDISVPELYCFAELCENNGDIETGIKALHHVIGMVEDHARALFEIARLYSFRDRNKSLEYIHKTLKKDIGYFPDFVDVIHKIADSEQAKSFDVYKDEWESACEQASVERNNFTLEDEFLPHRTHPDFVADLRTYFASNPEFQRVYLIRKGVTYLPHLRQYCFVFDIDLMHDNVKTSPNDWFNRIMKELNDRYEFSCFPFGKVLEDNDPWLGKLESVEDSLVYSKSV
jgi:hypothetical protein